MVCVRTFHRNKANVYASLHNRLYCMLHIIIHRPSVYRFRFVCWLLLHHSWKCSDFNRKRKHNSDIGMWCVATLGTNWRLNCFFFFKLASRNCYSVVAPFDINEPINFNLNFELKSFFLLKKMKKNTDESEVSFHQLAIVTPNSAHAIPDHFINNFDWNV